MLGDVEHQLDVIPVQSLASPKSKELRGLQHVLDLPSVQNEGTGEIVKVGFTDLMRQCALEVLKLCLVGVFCSCLSCEFWWFGTGCCLRGIVLLEEVRPDGATGLGGEFVVLDTDHDAALEGLVEGLNTVCREDHVAVVVLQDAKEYADQLIVLELVQAALFQEDVGLI